MDPRFEELLLRYAEADTNTARTRVEKSLWKEFGHKKAIFIMDMSGFSILTQKYGIVHYLSMVKRMQLTSRPIIEKHGGNIVKYEADNCFAMFDDVPTAVNTSIELNTAFQALNTFTDDDLDIRVSIGIDYGDVLLVGGPDYFGNTVNRASKLGEDIAGPGEIYLTETAYAKLPVKMSALKWKRIPLTISGIKLTAFKLTH